MSYRTYFSLTIQNGDEDAIISDLINNVPDAPNFDDGDCTTWYTEEEDMREFSKKYPEAIFCLHGEGEESDDLWDTYYQNGKMQHCPAVITYAPFDPEKLK